MSWKNKAGVCAVAAIITIVLANHPQEIRTTKRGLELIGNAEGCRLKPYTCPADVLTVGIGTSVNSGQKIKKNKTYTEAEVAQMWVRNIQQAETCVNQYANGKNLPQGAFEALTSITFNVGCGKMQQSTLFKMAKQGYSPEMCDQFPRWIYANGNKLKGLEKRRKQEQALCLTAD